jgi:hypothetical protein
MHYWMGVGFWGISDVLTSFLPCFALPIPSPNSSS